MLFTASQFTASKFSTAEEKAKFANQFVKFAECGFEQQDFPKWFYQRLSLSFGHIAHYDQRGFYEHFFTDNSSLVQFIDQILEYPCYGDPEWTYSDVEKAIQDWLKESGIRVYHTSKYQEEIDRRDRLEFERLQRKFGGA
jgi:hypothetical protein